MRKKKNRTGFQFQLFEDVAKSPFDKLFDIFKELITHTSGDFDEALDWLEQLDQEYQLTDENYTLDDFVEELKEKGLFVAPVEKKYLQLPEPTAQDNLPDITRLISYLKLKHDEHRLEVDLSVIRKLPDAIREDDFKVTATLVRPVVLDRTAFANVHPLRLYTEPLSDPPTMSR